MFLKNKKYKKLIKEATSLFKNEQYEEAVLKYEEAFKFNTILKDFIVYTFLLIDLNQLSKAELMLKDLSNQIDIYEIHYSLGLIYEKTNRKYDAMQEYKKAAAEEPNFDQVHFSLAYLYDELAEENKENLNGENIQKAIEHYETCLKLDSSNLWANINLGNIYERNNEDEKALYYFKEAYKLDHTKKMVCYNIGVACYKLKKYDESLKYYLEELTNDDPYENTYYNIGVLYKDAFRDYEKSRYYYLKALEKNKEEYSVWYNLGCVHALCEDFEQAFECFKYIYYKNKKILDFIPEDNELEQFRKTKYYTQLMNKL